MDTSEWPVKKYRKHKAKGNSHEPKGNCHEPKGNSHEPKKELSHMVHTIELFKPGTDNFN